MDESLLQYSYTSLDDLRDGLVRVPFGREVGREAYLRQPHPPARRSARLPGSTLENLVRPGLDQFATAEPRMLPRSPRSLKASAAPLSASLESRLAEDELARFLGLAANRPSYPLSVTTTSCLSDLTNMLTHKGEAN